MRTNKMVASNPDKTFFTADPHFFHANSIELCKRPFNSIEEMNKSLIRNWNAVVPREGEVFVLGDMFWKKQEKDTYAAVMDSLNGKKYLVMGNHDHLTPEEYLQIGFSGAWHYLDVVVEKQRLACFHYPILEWAGFYQGSWHLHGHVHGRGSHFSKRVMDVGVDCNYYTPVHWKEIKRRLADGFQKDQEAMLARGDTMRHCPYVFE